MTFSIAGMSPLLLGTDVLAIQDIAYSPDLISQPFQHSGNEFPSVGFRPGARPTLKYRTPIKGIYDHLATLKGKSDTALGLYFSTFANGLRRTGSTHTKLTLPTGCTAFTWIDAISCRQYGVAMADVMTMLLWSPTGPNTFPLERTNNVALPSLGSEPKLHTFGPMGFDAAIKRGAVGHAFRNNCKVVAPVTDGYGGPTDAFLMELKPQFMIESTDPLSVLDELGLEGEEIATSVALQFTGIDAVTGKRETTGFQLSGTSGHRYSGEFKFSLTDPATAGIIVDLLSSSGTHPVSVNTSATILAA